MCGEAFLGLNTGPSFRDGQLTRTLGAKWISVAGLLETDSLPTTAIGVSDWCASSEADGILAAPPPTGAYPHPVAPSVCTKLAIRK